MPGQLSQTKRVELFKAYCERRSVQHVARVCGVSPTTALRYKRMDDWDGRLKGITRKADEKIDDMMARQAKQSRTVQAKALQKIVDDGFKTSRGAADAYFKAAQEERVIRGEPSDRLNLVQEQMNNSRENYDRLKKLLADEEFRDLADKMLEIEMRIDAGRETN